MIIAHVTTNFIYTEEDIIYLKFKDREEFINTMGAILANNKLYLWFIKLVEIKEN